MNTQAVILAAGVGTRIERLGVVMPKCLFCIGSKSLLVHHFINLFRIGIKNITVVGGHKFDVLQNNLAGLPGCEKVELLFNPFYRFTDSIVSLWIFLRFVQIKKGLIVISGDRLLHPAIYQALEKLSDFSIVAVGPSKEEKTHKDSLVIAEDRLVRIGEPSLYLSGGVFFVPAEKVSILLRSTERIITTEEGSRAWYLSVLAELIKCGEVIKVLVFPTDYCVNINKPENLNDYRISTIIGASTNGKQNR